MTPAVLPDAASLLQDPTRELVLASTSITRQTLLRDAGLAFRVHAVPVDEAELKRDARADGLTAGQAALRLAEAKASAAMTAVPLSLSGSGPDAAATAALPPGAGAPMVIGADQMLECEGRWLDKPADLAEAADHLRFLSGRDHRLHTAVVVRGGDGLHWTHLETPSLRMRTLSAPFIKRYLAAEGEFLLGSVGAYRLEKRGQLLFERVDGEHAAILGLPMRALLDFLRRQEVLLS
ncbi:Maf family protein [Rhizosaccharibacter radicis]|uniref:Nucleoside triphosphate pyrophosphatase n=1 Tax=Rhizosaccharibacter radicis TaxID=2782605 RepID=A0ABT1VUP0_9PROT|nr:Maf family protein [Acetobacteraceae bacterium KSS12]